MSPLVCTGHAEFGRDGIARFANSLSTLKLRWMFRRPAVLFRTAGKLGWGTALQLAHIRLRGSAEKTYTIRIPTFPYPVTIRGGASSDALALYELLVQREYDPVGDLDSPHFIIDAGANVGIASLYFLNRYPTARVVAVEPEPGNFEICRRNLAPYGDRAILLQGAVWKNDGALVIERRNEEWSTRVKAGDANQSGAVQAFTMQSLMAYGNGQTDLLKMDIEGSELEVFGPNAQEWLPHVGNIAIEMHSRACREQVFSALKGYRYDLLNHASPDKNQDWTYVVYCRNLRLSAAGS
jgi:FkbM family methyltransferase